MFWKVIFQCLVRVLSGEVNQPCFQSWDNSCNITGFLDLLSCVLFTSWQRHFVVRRNKCAVIQVGDGYGLFRGFSRLLDLHFVHSRRFAVEEFRIEVFELLRNGGGGGVSRTQGNLTIRFALWRRKDWLFFIKTVCPGGRPHVFKYRILPLFAWHNTDFHNGFFFSFAQSHKYCMFFKWKLLHKAKISLDTVILLEGNLNAVQ